MTEDSSTLNQLQEELKAADEVRQQKYFQDPRYNLRLLQKSGGNTAAFPMELLKTREILENNPVDEELVKTNGSVASAVERVTAKRKIDENEFDDENIVQINGHEEKKVNQSV